MCNRAPLPMAISEPLLARRQLWSREKSTLRRESCAKILPAQISSSSSQPSRSPPLGGVVSKPITGETRYALSCVALDGSALVKTATVRVIPTFQEL